jgi:hypothetical protein
MNEESSKKRKLPRHVDGRIMIGPVPIGNFFVILPVTVAITIVVIKYFSPAVFFSGFVALGILIGLASEFHQKETGFLIIRDFIRYAIEGEKYFERNSKATSFHKRFTVSKIK